MNALQSFFVTLIKAGNYGTPASQKLYDTARLCLGQNLCPQNNEFGCAESVNNVVFKAFGDYAGGDLFHRSNVPCDPA